MTYEEALEAHSDAVDAVLRQRELVREAQAHLLFLEDERTRCWVRLQDAGRAVRRAKAQYKAPKEVLEDINKMYNRAARREESK